MAARRTTKNPPIRRTPATAMYRAALPWAQVGKLWLDIGWAAPQVIAYRTRRMLSGGPFPLQADRDEFRRMFEEKAEAWFEASWRMSTEMGRQWLEIATSTMQPWWLFSASPAAGWQSAWRGAARQWARSAPHIARLGTVPVHRRATANARRLGRRDA